MNFVIAKAKQITGSFNNLFDIEDNQTNELLATILNTRFANLIDSGISGNTFKDILTKMDSFELMNDLTNECDENLDLAITNGKTIYHNDDLKILNGKWKSLVSYIEKHHKEILKNFDAFFNNEAVTAEIIDSVLFECKGIKDIKIKLFNECQEKVIIENYEKEYLEFIVKNDLRISQSILFQFTGVELPVNKKLDLLLRTIANGNIDTEQLVDFVKSIGGEYKFDKKGIARVSTGGINEKISALLQTTDILTRTKRKDKLVLTLDN